MDHLFTPWRMDYIRSSKQDGCIFCDMLEMEDCAALILCRGKHAFLVMNRYPYNNGHFMAVPYRHIDTIEAFIEETDDAGADFTWPFGFDPAVGVNGTRLRTARRKMSASSGLMSVPVAIMSTVTAMRG